MLYFSFCIVMNFGENSKLHNRDKELNYPIGLFAFLFNIFCLCANDNK